MSAGQPALPVAAAEATHVPLAVIDGDLNVVWANPAFRLAAGRSLAEAFDVASLRAAFAPVFDHGAAAATFAPDGPKPVRLHARRVPAAGPDRVLVEWEDRSEFRAAEAELANRSNLFLSMLAHDLRNPLAPIITAVRIMQDADPHSAIWDDARKTVERQVEQVTRLVEDLLDVACVTSGKIALALEPVDLRDVVNRAVEAAQPLIESLDHDLTVSLPSKKVVLDADADRMTQVVVNLLTNAAKYTEPGGRVWLEVRADAKGRRVTVAVRDTGMGIAPDLLPRLFDLFMQADRPLSRATGGLGLGLTLVRTLVQLHGGTVAVESAGPGEGSTFTVTLPFAPAAEVAPAAAPPPMPRTPGRGLRVVVVDDNKAAADTMAVMLRSWGHEVRVAYSGPAGVELVEAERPDAALIDIGLPGLDGYEVAERLRADGVAIPLLVAVTGYGQDGDGDRSIAAGFHKHLVKPLKPQELADILARAGRA